MALFLALGELDLQAGACLGPGGQGGGGRHLKPAEPLAAAGTPEWGPPHPPREHLLEEEPLQVSVFCLKPAGQLEGLRSRVSPGPITRSLLLLPPLCLWSNSISLTQTQTPGTLLQKSGHTPVSPP